MSAIDQVKMQSYIEAGVNAANTTEQGRALEDMMCFLFGLVPGIAITQRNKRNVFETEEIDIALWNDKDPAGFIFLPDLIVVECKNWSKKVGSMEVNWFDTKLRTRGLNFGIFVSPHGITGNPADLSSAHQVISNALLERRRLVVLTVQELLGLPDTKALIKLIKIKLCTLAISGTIT